MGLFINSNLQSLNVHKRLTELEKLSEISTGIIALKNMVESGDNLQDRKQALDNLTRILPMLSANQQQYVLDEIFTPLMREMDDEGEMLLNAVIESGEAGPVTPEGASSDYEMEFQLTLNRQAHALDLKQLNREQRDFRHQRELDNLRAERDQRRAEEIEKSRQAVFQRIDENWATLKLSGPPQQQQLELKKFIFRFASGLGRTHPKVLEARERLNHLKRPS